MLGNLNESFKKLPTGPKNLQFSIQDLTLWDKLHRFRTSTRDMTKSKPQKGRSSAIPGYSGYMPGYTSGLHTGKAFSKVAQQIMFRGKLARNQEKQEHFRSVSCIPFEIQEEDSPWTTSYQKAFLDQEKIRHRVWRNSDPGKWISANITKSPLSLRSGFSMNNILEDGNRWVPIKELEGNMAYSEYRNRYLGVPNYHPPPLRPSLRTLKRKTLVYQLSLVYAD